MKLLENRHCLCSFFAASQPRIDLRQLEIELGVVRMRLNRFLQFGQGRLVLLQSDQALAKAAQREQVLRIERPRLLETLKCLLIFAASQREVAQRVVRLLEARVDSNRILKEPSQ